MRAVRDGGSRAGKSPAVRGSRTALYEMRTETTLLLYKSRLSVKMSDVCAHSDTEFYYPKKKRKKKEGKARWSYDKMLIDGARWGRTIKYLALGYGARISLRSGRSPCPPAQPRSQGLSSLPPLSTTMEAEKRDPGNEVASGPPTQSISTYNFSTKDHRLKRKKFLYQSQKG